MRIGWGRKHRKDESVMIRTVLKEESTDTTKLTHAMQNNVRESEQRPRGKTEIRVNRSQ